MRFILSKQKIKHRLSLLKMLSPWRSGYHYCTILFNYVWTQFLCRFKSYSQRVGDSRWWDLWHRSRLEIRLNAFRWSTKPHKNFFIIIRRRTSNKSRPLISASLTLRSAPPSYLASSSNKHRTSKWCGAYEKFNHNLTVNKLKRIWSKHTNYEKLKISSISGIS